MWGDKEDFLYDVWAQQKHEPQALASKPDLSPYLNEAYKGFRILSTRRPSGFSGPGPIPLTDILAYQILYDIEDVETFTAWIIAADLAFMNHLRSLKKVEAGEAGKK